MKERIRMKMFIAGLFTGGVIGGVLGVAMICLVTAGKWADEEMERASQAAEEKRGNPSKENTEESQVDGCGNETM